MSENLVESVFKAVDSLSTEGIAVLDKDGEYIYLNPRHAEMYGYKSEELIGKTWKELYSEENANLVESEIMPKLFEFGKWEQKLTGQKKDGTSIRCRVSLTLLDEGLFCICEDITERERIIEAEKQDMIQKIIKITQE